MNLRLGLRSHDVSEHSLTHLLAVLKQYGLTNVQFAPFKFLPGDFVNQTNMLTPGLMTAIQDKFVAANAHISVLGCYVNIVDNDVEQRQRNVNSFKDSLALARYVGGPIVATETGSLSDNGYTEANFTETAYQRVLASVKQMAYYAEKYGAIMAIEAGINHPIYNNQIQKRLLDEVDSPNVKIIYDLTNILTPENLNDQGAILAEAEKLFKDDIFEFHIKDFVFDHGEKKTVPFGEGVLDAERYIKFISKLKPYSDCILEGLKEDRLEQSLNFINQIDDGSNYQIH
ncbi:sugar phosphate isomerase/epimerase family protein [Paucilactobacillus wasatchensis]|uniref:Xylose isomerase-like TIM barrel domain-containing protein n=1 Tax=Paucilactobacillus wasatchensis TaxID=1335616 RepID=A0A0D0YX91_9LACO|nr:sugar phosphate isomerase/epimerase family protein [Paucilactobacillus wasatchensis]KIS03859.1 hypothetical protein WDC_0506 [Paucilactobacillus wasatchensis]